MVLFKNLKTTGLPADYRQTGVWMEPSQLNVNYYPPAGKEGEPSYTVTCSPAEASMTQVAGFETGETGGEKITKSPTGLYQLQPPDRIWGRRQIFGEARRSFDTACERGNAELTPMLKTFRKNADGLLHVLPLKEQKPDDRAFLKTLIEEYGFRLGERQKRDKLNGADIAAIPTIVLNGGGWLFHGVDLDSNGRLDVLVARQQHSGREVFLYNLEKMPLEIQEKLPDVSFKKKLAPLGFPCQSDNLTDFEKRACGGFSASAFIPPAPISDQTKPEEDRSCDVCACVQFPHPNGFLFLKSGTALYPLYPFQGRIQLSYDRFNPAETFVTRLPGPIFHRTYSLPPLPKGNIWLPGSFAMEEPRWLSPQEGEVVFQIRSASPGGDEMGHTFRIPFTKLSDCDVRFIETLEPVLPQET